MKGFDSAYLLAGGRSSRFGENKALVSVFGETLIVRLASQLASNGLRATLVVQEVSDYAQWGIPSIEDGVPNSGPLAGVLAALRDADRLGIEWCFISSCDILDWRPEWRARLVSAIQSCPNSVAAVLSNGDAKDFRPFPGLYRTLLWEFGSELWSEGVRSMREFHRRIDKKVEKCLVAHDLLPKSFNTPAELQRLLIEKERD